MNKKQFPLKKSGQEILGSLRIGVDIDDNILDLCGFARKKVLEKYNLDIFESGLFYFPEWSEIKKIPGGPEYLYKLFYQASTYQKLKPITGAIRTLNKWQEKGHQLWFITARAQKLKPVTLNWFDRHGLDWAKEKIIFRDHINQDRSQFKAREALKIDPHVFIEDEAVTIKSIKSPFLKIKLVLKQPWNIDKEMGDLAQFVDSWEQMDEIIRKLSQQHRLSQDLFVAS